MRKLERDLLQAIESKVNKALSNTTVSYNDDNDCSLVMLHGNHIATYNHDGRTIVVNKVTLKKYPTTTTKSRLRALGVDVFTKKGVTYLDGKPLV